MKKRGVELSMNLIIIAAIALIILVILIMLVTGTGGDILKGTSCQERLNGQCIELSSGESCAEAVDEGYVKGSSRGCQSYESCCYKPFGDT